MIPSDADSDARYRLKFIPAALKEWQDLDGSVREPLRKALKKRLEQPHVPGSQLSGDLYGCYKIKLRKQGYRLVYMVEDDILVVLVLAIDRREDMAVYHAALARFLAKHP